MTTTEELEERLILVEGTLAAMGDKLMELLGPDEPTPEVVDPPVDFIAVYNPERRTITCKWKNAERAAATEVHEFTTDPSDTLKATVAVPGNSRESGKLAGGHNYTYGGRSVLPNGQLGSFTPQVTVYVPFPKETTTPVPPKPSTPAAGRRPNEVLDLRFWTLMRDTGSQGDPDNGYPLDAVVENKFFVREDGGVVFRARAGGVHSQGSKFCRYELRQMDDAAWKKSAWNSSGKRSLECVIALNTDNLVKRKRLNGMQIHGGSDDICQIMLHETWGLGFMHNDGKSWVSIDPAYESGTKCTVKIEAGYDRIVVWYNGVKKVDVPKKGTTWFWKMGCYLQTDVPTYKEDPSATGEVVIWSYTLA
jgi:hypothetical protein